MTYIASNLKYLRKLSNLSQEAFAREVGLNRGNIASYEKGNAEPNSVNLLKITRFFHVDLVDFIDRDLSLAIENEDLNFESAGDKIILEKESLAALIGDLPTDEDLSVSAQVLIERSLSLRKILEGIQAYRQYRKDASPDPSTLVFDYERLMEITEEIFDINRQLIRLLIQS